MTNNKSDGLEHIIAGYSNICYIDGENGKLVYKGYDVIDLIDNGVSFEEVIYLLHNNNLPTINQLKNINEAIFNSYSLPQKVIEIIKSISSYGTPMFALQSSFPLLQIENSNTLNKYEDEKIGLHLVAQMSSLVAAIGRIYNNQEVIMPKKNLSIAANFLYMLKGEKPDSLHEEIMNTSLILHADHEFNASTFSGRVTAATESDIYSAITSAIGTLKGPLHGGANENVMRLLFEIDDVANAKAIILNKLNNGEKISGFGHRVYKTTDPRARKLKIFSKEISEHTKSIKWYEITEEIEKIVFDVKKLHPNVDLYSASIYYAMGIDLELFTPVFAVSRVAGWSAHILEQYDNNRLIRPASKYTGTFNREFVPLKKRE